MIKVRLLHLPPDSATAVALGGPGWLLEHYLAAHIFQAVNNGEPHPALPKYSPIADPEREKRKRQTKARAHERQRAIDAGEIT